MEKRTKNGVSWLEFSLLAPFIHHGIFLRSGGVSLPPFGSLNTCSRVGDSKLHVAENISRVRSALDLPPVTVTMQMHGDVIATVPSSLDKIRADGLISKEAGSCMGIHHADCQAAIFYDTVERCLAVIHCGWRGSCLNIYEKCIHLMGNQYKCLPENILVGISPSLGPKNAEFTDWQKMLPTSFAPFVENDRVNFWEASKTQLLDAGILEAHIEIAEICTADSPNAFFSYRRQKETGRNLTVACLKAPSKIN